MCHNVEILFKKSPFKGTLCKHFGGQNWAATALVVTSDKIVGDIRTGVVTAMNGSNVKRT